MTLLPFLRFAICDLRFAIYGLRFAVCDLRLIMHKYFLFLLKKNAKMPSPIWDFFLFLRFKIYLPIKRL